MKTKAVKPAGRYRLQVEFDDGVSGVVDLGDLSGRGVFKAWEKPGAFEDVTVGSGGEVVWNCGVDYCADAMYMRLTGKTIEEVMPALRVESKVA